MKRLSGLDAGFLYMETPTSFMHVASLMVLDPTTAPDGFDFDALRALYASRLHLAPPFRRRLVEVPLGLNHPIWIEDPDFDLDWHLRRVRVPTPGGMRELCRLAADLVAIPLDRSRPLWEAWFIEGLEGGDVGLLTKVHHAAIDGASGEELMVALLDLSPEPEPRPDPERPWQPEHVPTDTEMVGHALWSLAQQPARAVKTARRTVEAALRIRELNRRDPSADPPPSPFSAPRTSFNAALTAERAFATASLPLGTVKAVKNAAGTTVNDVVLTVCAGALRAYLDQRGERPDGPLVAMVPVSVRTEDQRGTQGNRVSSMLTSLATDLDDPAERLAAIAGGMAAAKEQHHAIGADTLQDWVEFAAPAVAGQAARLYSSMRIADRHRPLFNVTISNVPGPPFPLYLAGARMRATYPMGPIFDGGGLNITVMSYQEQMDFGLVVCPALVPDPWVPAGALHDALDALAAAVGVAVPEPSAARPGA